jgi:hypothetical protein
MFNDAILTWNLGISPLLNDADKTYNALRYDLPLDPTSLLIKAKGWVAKQDVDSEKFVTNSGGTVCTSRVNSFVKYTSVIIARPSISDMALLERLGLANPVSLAAELTTLSFLVNYFWGILDYLKATSTPMAFEWYDGSWSLRVSHLQWLDVASSSESGNRKATGRWVHSEYTRKVYSTFPIPIPPLSFKSGQLTDRQAVNTAAIVWSKVRKALSQ